MRREVCEERRSFVDPEKSDYIFIALVDLIQFIVVLFINLRKHVFNSAAPTRDNSITFRLGGKMIIMHYYIHLLHRCERLLA